MLQNFHVLIFRVEKFSYKWTYGTKNCRSTFRRKTNARDQDSEAWRSSKELTVFEATMCIRKYGRQLLKKSWCVREKPTTVTIVTQ